MIELPEAVLLAGQIGRELGGKVIREGNRGNWPHKFAFYTYPPEEYARVLPGKTIGSTGVLGGMVLVRLEPGYTLVLGCGGERILYHPTAATIPARHHFLACFTDGSALSVNVSGWGAALLLTDEEKAEHPFTRDGGRMHPHTDEFTLQRFLALWDDVPATDSRAVKLFMISRPGLHGMGNGYLQDILLRAGLHPRRRAGQLSMEERERLYHATRQTLLEAIAKNGRDTERDLYNQPGGYVPLLDQRAKGRPCPQCGATIEKIAFLGGACYLCPACQPLP